MMMRFFVVIPFLLISLPTLGADCGRFQVVKGLVQYKIQGKKKFKKARKNHKICQGDTVKTGSDGRAKIEMADKNILNLSPKTEMVIETYKNTERARIHVLNGKVRSDVNNKYKDNQTSHFRVRTKSAVAGVRGTEFLTSFNAQTGVSDIVTFKGQVAVSPSQGTYQPRVIVAAGRYTRNSSNTPLIEPRVVSPQQLAEMRTQTNIEPIDVREPSGDPGVQEALPNEDNNPEPADGEGSRQPSSTEPVSIDQEIDNLESSILQETADPTADLEVETVANPLPVVDSGHLQPPNTEAPELLNNIIQNPKTQLQINIGVQ